MVVIVLAGGRIEIDVVPNLDDFNSTLNRGLNGALKIGAAFGVSFGAATAFSEVITLGNDLTNTLNTMQSVSSATASEMEAVSARAKELGNDINLSNTSASDAAAAMTELAKGGFTVQQAMDGAKGTLQLAAAAGIDAASAATIQSQALQAFGLSADYAATAADVLANAANASSAEITDISAGLQQSGAVANSFGLTIEDTAATLSVLSNAGIAGSDAGTLLKSSLLALTDQGKPAQAAIEELGLTVYDAQGQFVGMSSLFGQLDTAAASMTPELYQAATATLFGSDAMRLASVAAEQGSAGYDKMHTAIERQGAAAEVAAAKSKGLPGALAAIQNSAENLALEMYDLIDGPIRDFALGAADKLTNATGGIIEGLNSVGSAASPVISVIGSVAKAVASLPIPILAATGALVALKVTGMGSAILAAFASTSAASYRFTQAMAAQVIAANLAGGSMSRVGAATAVAGARMATAAGTMLSAFGGPWMIGIVAAGAAIYSLYSEFNKAEKQQDLLTGSSAKMATAQRDVAKAFQESQGAISEGVTGAIGVQFDTFIEKQNQLASTAPGSMAIFKAAGQDIAGWFSGVAEAGTDALNAQEKVAGEAEAMKGAFDRTGLSAEELAAKLTASDTEFNTFAAVLRNSGDGGAEAADAMREMREQVEYAEATAKNTSPGFYDLSTAVGILGDEASTADERVNALKTALDVLSGKEIPLSDAVQKYNDTIRDIGDAKPESVDPSKGVGDALVNADSGAVNTQLENGSKLRDQLTGLRDETINVTNATIAAALAQGKTLPEAQAEARNAIAANEASLINLGSQYGLTKTQVEAMAQAEGLLPEEIIMLASLAGSDDVALQLEVLGSMLKGVGQPVDIPVEMLDEDARRRIIELGGSVEENINGKPGIVRITAPNEEALRAIREVDNAAESASRERIAKISVNFAIENPNAVSDAVREAEKATGRRVNRGQFASGGRLPTTGPGTSATDGILGVTSAGQPIANVDAGEWIINRGSSEQYNRELAMINAGTFPKLPGFQGGGVVDGMTDWVNKYVPGLSMTSGLRNTDSGYHSTGNAADFSNGSGNTPEQLSLAEAISQAYPDSLELIYDDPAFAGQEIKNGARVDSSFYDGAGDHTNHVHWAMSSPPSLDRAPGSVGVASGAPLSERDQIAQDIIDEGKRRGITANGIKAALMTGLAESDLQNLEYGDRDSVGVFQQRDNGAWGTAEDRMNPTRAAGMFYEQLAKFDYESMDAAAAAQRVQQSAFADGSNYAVKAAEADAILSAAESRGSAYGSDGADVADGKTGFEGAANSKWAEKDKLALDSARVAIRQAQEDRDAAYVNDKKTQADREQADLKVQKAEQKVRDLEAKRDTPNMVKGSKSDAPAPDAPELTGNMTDDEISLKSAELAVEKARLARNEAYAKDGATEADKLDADLSLQRAKNALDAERKTQAEGGSSKSGSSGGASDPVDLIGNVAKSFVTGQLNDALGVFGISSDMGAIGALITGVANYKPADIPGGESATGLKQLFGQPFVDELGKAAGANPDAPFDPSEWLRRMGDQVKIPTVLRDSGGPLLNGMAALNLSGDTEHVYTGKQNSDMFKELADIRNSVSKTSGGSSLDMSEFTKQVDRLAENASRPNVTFQTDNIAAAMREDRVRQARQSLTYSRR
ncbi:phage tail tape measure protein [Rhodococcus fascians]|nr:phage tail tape measure protein [Rhodococcus fascians]MBY4237777.1 phage tail tape measure protein [Rhodococcus fascians]MBY4253980.1 phage tail tape measure protein [Rhodococcus fascians]MBY4269149.1 phage tail tape measure protein [Rhodococcus fascians]